MGWREDGGTEEEGYFSLLKRKIKSVERLLSTNSSRVEEKEGVCEDMDYELGSKGGRKRLDGEGGEKKRSPGGQSQV